MPPFLGSEYHEDKTVFAAHHPWPFDQHGEAFRRRLLLLWFGDPLFVYLRERNLQLCSGSPQFLFVEKPDSEISHFEG